MKLLGLAVEEETSREDVDQTMGRVGIWAKKEQLGLEKRTVVCRRVEVDG